MNRMEREFFSRDTLTVAKALLGKVFCRKNGGKIYKGIIVETEAYTQDDPACHAFGGLTPRTKSLFSKPGTLYVYLIYGMHHCANISTDREGWGSGVLIRALEPVENITETNGPARLCKSMEITRLLDGSDLTAANSPVWLEEGTTVHDNNIIQTTRIGIKKAADLKWRFCIKDNQWVSVKPK